MRGCSGVKPVGAEAQELCVGMNQQQYLFVLGKEKCCMTHFPLSLQWIQWGHPPNPRQSETATNVTVSLLMWIFVISTEAVQTV